ncbi:MAG: phosphorylase, partial [Jaaginema sp. PMC 1079.18]|nr:phosphorylase [Jaaginema sp. PMC 1079.18]
NKYNVVDRHLLMITRAFESQENWLNINDFEAMWACLAGVEGLAFYNGGAIAGASQPHKHLQLIPLVSEETVYSLPIAPAIAQIQWDTEIATIPVFNFPHAIAKFDFSWQDSLTEAATATLALYRRLLHHLGIEIQGENATQAYNLLATRQWLLIVPRSRADYAGIPVNSLGFAGALLVKSSQQLAYLKALGPLNLLEKVAVNNKLCN